MDCVMLRLFGKQHNLHMVDTCVLGTNTQNSDWTGGSANSWAYGQTTYRCRVDETRHDEVPDGTGTVITDAVITLPLDTSVTSLNRIKVTHRWREALSEQQVFAIVGAPNELLNRIECQCTRVIGESVT